MHERKRILFILIIPISMVLFSCRAEIPVYQNRYNPMVDPAKYRQLSGKNLCLATISNEDNATTIWSIYSPDRKIRYSFYKDDLTPNNWTVVQSFAWYAAEKYFTRAGLNVWGDCPIPPEYPEIEIMLRRFSDRELLAKVIVHSKDAPKYQTYVSLSFDPQPADHSPSQQAGDYEKRIYEILDKFFQAIMDDPGIRRAAFR